MPPDAQGSAGRGTGALPPLTGPGHGRSPQPRKGHAGVPQPRPSSAAAPSPAPGPRRLAPPRLPRRRLPLAGGRGRAGRFVTSRSAVGRSRFVRGSGGRGAEPRSRTGDVPPAAPAPAATSAPAGAAPPPSDSARCRYRQGECASRGTGAPGWAGVRERRAAVRRGSGPDSTGAFVWRRTGPGRGSRVGAASPPPPRCCLFRHRRIKPGACAPLPLAAPGWKAAVTSPHFHMTLGRHEAASFPPTPPQCPPVTPHGPGLAAAPPGGVTAPCLGPQRAGRLGWRWRLSVGTWGHGGVSSGSPAVMRHSRSRGLTSRGACPVPAGLPARLRRRHRRSARPPGALVLRDAASAAVPLRERASLGWHAGLQRQLFVFFFPEE